jgi:arylformamidase
MEIDAYLEKQYNNRAAVPEHPRFIEGWQTRSEAFRAEAKHGILDVAYGDHPRMLLDIFPAAEKNAPVHLFIHGGYWQALSKDSFSFVADHFNRNGETAVIVNYALCPQVTLATIIDQIRTALRWIYRHIAEYGGNPTNIQASGHSAGGHLLGCLLTDDWSDLRLNHAPLSRLNSLSGLFDLRPLLATTVNQGLQLDEVAAAAASPLSQSAPSLAPEIELNLLVGSLESDEYWRQSTEVMQAWRDLMKIDQIPVKDCHHFSILDGFLEHHYRPLALVR